MAVVGAGAGLIGAWLFRKAVAQLVFEVSPADPITFIAAAAVLIVLAGIACLIPAGRAIRIDPIVALRYE
jgi:ABC-type antimicrobial peptide transport system permease subunit